MKIQINNLIVEGSIMLHLDNLKLNDIKVYSYANNIPEIDLIMILINLLGVNYKNNKDDINKFYRGRFKLYNADINSPVFLAVSINSESPFIHTGSKIILGNYIIGLADDIEYDSCSTTYFRNNGSELTINNNILNKCNGCKFCSVSLIGDNQEPRNLDTVSNLLNEFDNIINKYGLNDLSNLDSVGIVTGCFRDEKETVDNILKIYESLKHFNFRGEIKYIGSQIRSFDSIDTLCNAMEFGLYLTVECFEKREKLMRRIKHDVSLEEGREILLYSKEKGIETTFMYILGLDSLEIIQSEFPKYLPVITRHPLINLFQCHTYQQKMIRNKKAIYLDYYLEARKIIEDIFIKTNFRPRVWENYRSPWIVKYKNDIIQGNKI